MRSILSLVLPHEPNAVFQGQLVQVDLSRFALKHDLIRRIGSSFLEDFGDNLFFTLNNHTLAVSETCPDLGRLILINLFEHDEFLGTWLEDLANFVYTFILTWDPIVHFGEFEMNFNCFVKRAFSIGDKNAVVMRRVQCLNQAVSVWKLSFDALCNC